MATVTKAANAHTAVSGAGFSNPSNAYATTGDNVYATAALTSTANTTVSGDFGFANFTTSDIPDYSTITQVALNTEYAISATVTGLATGIQIYRDGAAAGTEVTRTSLTEAVATQTISSNAASSAAWIADLRAASTDIKGRVRITKGNTTNLSTLSLDYISLTVTYTAPSTVSTLSALTFTAGSLSPTFASGTTSYTINPVPYATSTTTFTATATGPVGTTGNTGFLMEYRVGGTGSWTTLSHTAGVVTSPSISLTAGASTTVEVRVTAEDGSSQSTYTVVLTRRPAPFDFQTDLTVDGDAILTNGYDGATLSNATLTNATLSNATLTTPIITQGTSTPSFTTNTYTLVLSDAGELLLASNSTTAGSVKIPTNATVAFPVGTQIHIIQTGSGQLTISATTSGTTSVLSTGATAASPKLRAQYSTATMLKTATDTWYVFGDIA